ncbi:MAG TPA: alpha/beta fold hydrolase [Myxococcales bacterium]|nr:alpha/beta fold hydrolase [Myxococcales bacterium]
MREDTETIERAVKRGGAVRARVRFVTVNRRRVRVLEYGRRGPPLVLFHGAGGWAETFGELLPALARAGYHLYACDLPGFGQSEPPPRVRYFEVHRGYYIRWVQRLMDQLQLQRATLVGHSLGGTVAMLTAASAPERVSRLVLMAPGGFGDLASYRLRLMGMPLGERLARYVPDRIIRGFLRANVHDPSCLPEWLYQDALRYSRAGGGAELARVMAQGVTLFGSSKFLREKWRIKLSRLRCPTLVLWGRQDRTLPVTHAVDAAEVLPGAVVEVISGAGHLLMLEKPLLVQRALLAFLRVTGARAGAAGRSPAAHAARAEVLNSGTDFAMQT